MLMLARCSVRSRAPAQFDLTLVKMLLKLDPLLFSDIPVLVIGTDVAASANAIAWQTSMDVQQSNIWGLTC